MAILNNFYSRDAKTDFHFIKTQMFTHMYVIYLGQDR